MATTERSRLVEMVSEERWGSLEGALDRFLGPFQSTAELAEQLLNSRCYPHDILILLCARIDALACSAAREETPNRKAFVDFIISYGGRRDLFESVSVGHLYYELAYHRWLLPRMVRKAGRLVQFSRHNESIIHFLEQTDTPLTVRDAGIALGRVMKALRRRFCVIPRQPSRKPFLGKPEKVFEAIEEGFQTRTGRSRGGGIQEAVRPLLYSKRIASILYEEYRSQSIHTPRALVNALSFLENEDIYWTVVSTPFGGQFWNAFLSGRFILKTLRACMETYRAHLLARGKLPPEVHDVAFGQESSRYLHLLDHDLLPQGRELKIQLKRR